MPKQGKKRGGGARSKGARDRDPAGSESDTETVFTPEDNASVLSDSSFMRDGEFNGAGGGEDDEELSQDDLIEIRLGELVDLAEQKSSHGRAEALKGLVKAFSGKMVPNFANSNQDTITGIVKKSLKKGAEEQVQAANLALALCIQLGGSGQDLEEIYRSVGPSLRSLLSDHSASPRARAACVNALGTLCFLAAPGEVEAKLTMDILEPVFQAHSKCSNDSLPLCTEAVSSWTLLSTMLSRSDVEQLLVSSGEVFGAMLESSDVDLKIATAEAIAVLYEYVYDASDDDDSDSELEETMEVLVEKLEGLSTGTHKGTSKKDKKSQKSSIREILSTVNGEEDFYEVVQINTREKLELTSWAQKVQHHALRKVLGSGTMIQLTQNEFVRKIFDLGAPLPSLATKPVEKSSKWERQSIIKENTKVRHAILRKNRDKRLAVI